MFSVFPGSTLAAVSESASASSSHPAYSSSLQSASTLALSALAHAGALMRTLMRSRVHGEDPLLLSTPYINTVGFQGDPTDLLYTRQTNQSNQHQVISSRSSSLMGHRYLRFISPYPHCSPEESEVRGGAGPVRYRRSAGVQPYAECS